MADEKTQAQRFEAQRGRVVTQPPPPFPRLPEKFVKRYEKEIQDALNLYSDQCQEWVRRYTTSQQ